MPLEPFATLTYAPSDRQKTAASHFSVRAVGDNPLAGPQRERYPGRPAVASLAGGGSLEQTFGDGAITGGLEGALAYAQRTERRSDGTAEVTITALVTLAAGGHATLRGTGREVAGGAIVVIAIDAPGLAGDAFIGEAKRDGDGWVMALSRWQPG
jgi:hypothetical protein